MGSPEPNQISQVQPQPDCKYTRSTTPGLKICMIGCRVAAPRSHWWAVPTPLFIYIFQLLRDSFFVSQQPPIWEPPSHYSMMLQLQSAASYRPWRRTIAGRITPISGLVSVCLFIYLLAAAAAAGPLADVTQFTGQYSYSCTARGHHHQHQAFWCSHNFALTLPF